MGPSPHPFIPVSLWALFIWGPSILSPPFSPPSLTPLIVWLHREPCQHALNTDLWLLVMLVMLERLHSVKVSVEQLECNFFLSWYPAWSHLCDRGICCGSPADSGSGPGQSEAWSLCWSNLQAERHEEGMNTFTLKTRLFFIIYATLPVSLPSVSMMMMFWVSLKWFLALFCLKKLITSLTRFRAAWRLVPVLRPWTAGERKCKRLDN